MKLIETKTLGSNQASIVFTSIPQDFTDLVVLASLRGTGAARRVGASVSINNSSANQTARALAGDHSFAGTFTETNFFLIFNGANAVANSFGNAQIYLPNYSGSTNKSMSVESTMASNDDTEMSRILSAWFWNQTAPINSLSFDGAFLAGSTISLYGITKGSDGIVTTTP
jgi:hypothetical protein